MTAAPKPEPRSSERIAALIDALELPPLQKDVLRQRWLDQMGWMSAQARKARRRHLTLRIPIVIGGVLIPALVTILLSTESDHVPWLGNLDIAWIRFLTFVVSLSVAILAGLEETFSYSDRWRHYRRTAELLKTLGWQYITLKGTFRRFPSHAEAFGPFAERVEDVINEDVEGYLGSLATAESRDRTRHEVIV